MSSKPRRSVRHRAGKGATLILAAILLGSGGLRLGVGADRALAQSDALPEGVQPEPVSTAVDGAREMAPPSSSGLKDRSDIAHLLEALTAREAQISERERQLETRRKALEVTDEEVRQRLADLARMEDQLRQTLTLADRAAEDDLARLTTVYETMKPKNAAALFETMEPAFAAGFLGRMRPDAAAAIMAGLTPETAYTISVIMAGRNARAPKT